MGAAAGGNGTYDVPLPDSDLLVWFAPRADCQLQLRYLWEGHAKAGEVQVFTQVYLPHRPYRPAATTNNPRAKGTQPSYANRLEATEGGLGDHGGPR